VNTLLYEMTGPGTIKTIFGDQMTYSVMNTQRVSLRMTKDVHDISASLRVDALGCEIDDADVLSLRPRPIAARHLCNTAFHTRVKKEQSKICDHYARMR
jgi:hypothetical protein